MSCPCCQVHVAVSMLPCPCKVKHRLLGWIYTFIPQKKYSMLRPFDLINNHYKIYPFPWNTHSKNVYYQLVTKIWTQISLKLLYHVDWLYYSRPMTKVCYNFLSVKVENVLKSISYVYSHLQQIFISDSLISVLSSLLHAPL